MTAAVILEVGQGEVMGAVVMFVEVGWFYMFVCSFFVVFFFWDLIYTYGRRYIVDNNR